VSFFSDGDITPELTSPAFSRPTTPKSDTELEVAKKLRRSEHSPSLAADSSQWDWNWGQFPERTAVAAERTANLPVESLKSKESSSSSSKILDGVLSLVSKNKATPDGNLEFCLFLGQVGRDR
jgi:hypothetical protein